MKSNAQKSKGQKSTVQMTTKPPVPSGQNGKKRASANASGLNSQAAPVAFAKGQRSTEPKFVQRTANLTRIVHRELVTSIAGTAAFTVANSLALNPGIAATFPWLSTQAVGWESYRFNKLRFCYYTRAATTDRGSVMLVPDYDAADSAPTSEQTASAYTNAVEQSPWVVEFTCDLDQAAMLEGHDRKYIRTGSLGPNLDIKTYDGGNLFVCTVDGAAVNWGKLWVEYDVTLFTPQLPSSGTSTVNSAIIQAGGSVSDTAYLGSAPTVTGGLSVSAVTNTITFNSVGQFLVIHFITGTGLAGAGTVTGTATAALCTTSESLLVVNATSIIQVVGYVVTVTSPGQTYINDFNAVATTISDSTTRIASYASALL
jgi:hypothetical protein